MIKKVTHLLLVAGLLAFFSSAASAHQDRHIKVSFIAENSVLQPGMTSWLGVLFEPEHHWHVYWQNPGDSGLAPSIALTLPEGVTAGKIHWPAPEQIPTQHMMNYGYHRVLLMVPITVDKSVATGQSLTFKAKTSWLVCREECVPGKAQLELTLPVAAAGEISATAKEFADARQLLPVMLGDASARYQIDNDRVVLELALDKAAAGDGVAIYPITADLVNYAELPQLRRKGNRLVASFALSDYFSSVPDNFEFVLVAGPDAVFQGSARAIPEK